MSVPINIFLCSLSNDGSVLLIPSLSEELCERFESYIWNEYGVCEYAKAKGIDIHDNTFTVFAYDNDMNELIDRLSDFAKLFNLFNIVDGDISAQVFTIKEYNIFHQTYVRGNVL